MHIQETVSYIFPKGRPMSSGVIGIFVATMTGLAEMCAEEIERSLTKAGIASKTHLMDGLTPTAFDPYHTIVIVSSTYGHGEIPDNGQALFEALEAGADLSSKRYAVFGMGDMTYADTFCAAGNRWDAVLQACNARRFVDVERHDASSGTLAEDVAAEWAAGWANEYANPLQSADAGTVD
jgi:MioC protein